MSAGLAGANVAEASEVGVRAAELAAGKGNWVAAGDVGAASCWRGELVAGRSAEDAADRIYRLVGTSVATQESVPAAFGVLAVHPDDPWQAVLMAASLGGDCDTIAAIAGAIAGACHGTAGFPASATKIVDEVNDLPLARLATDLLAIRSAS